MKHKIHLDASDVELIDAVFRSKPPPGVKVSKPMTRLECKAPGEIFLQIIIEFGVGVSSIVIGSWLYDCLKKSGKPRGTINRKEVIFEERHIIRFVEEERTEQDTHNSKRNDDDGDAAQ
jgi:hypothetical protein